jgi:hypothetical protein
MANFLAPIINGQQFDANGDPLSSGTIEVYLAGTSTPATTYTTQAGGTPNTFPIDLNTLGVNEDGEIWLIGGASYKFVIKDSAGVTLRTLDNMSGINDSAITTDQWISYQATPTYVSATSFTVAGDQTQTFQIGRRLKSTNTGGTIYSTITGSAYSSPNTTVTVRNDSGVLDSGISQVSYGIISVLNSSLAVLPHTSVELIYVTTTSIALVGTNGGYIWIDGINRSIGVGINKSLGTLTTTTVYNVYAYWTGSAIDLEFSTTGFTANSNGIPQKTGDTTRTLVGRIRTNSTTTTYNTASDAGVITYWNRKRRAVTLSIQANQNTASGTDVSVLTGPSYLSWALDATDFSSTAINGNTVDTAQNNTTIYVNGGALSASATTSISGAGGVGSASPRISSVVASGYVTTNLSGRVNAGTGTWYAGTDLQAVFLG